MAVRERDRGAARGPGAEAAEGGARREEGRVRLRGPGRHAHPDRPGRRGPAWVSGALPGSVHDKKAEWIWGVLHELEAAGLITLADKGYQGSTHAKIPYRGKNKPESQKEANRAHAKLRAPGERANALLKNWRILRKLRCCPWRAGQLAKAIHALEIHAA
jgi:hypothetical protein